MVLEDTPLETPVLIGAVGPTETVLLVLLAETAVDEEMMEELEVTGMLLVLFVLLCDEVTLEVETPVVKVTEDEMNAEEVVPFAVTIFDPVDEGEEDAADELVDEEVADELVEGADELLSVLETLLEEVEGAALPEEVDGATLLLLLELVGASLILRAPLIPLLVLGLPSVCFM